MPEINISDFQDPNSEVGGKLGAGERVNTLMMVFMFCFGDYFTGLDLIVSSLSSKKELEIIKTHDDHGLSF